jgi:hypothetical protein
MNAAILWSLGIATTSWNFQTGIIAARKLDIFNL